MKLTGIVERVDTRSVTTKFGVRPTFNITVGGQKYELGFGKHSAVVGSTVEFDYETTKYGNEVTKGSLLVSVAAGAVTFNPAPIVSGSLDVPKNVRNYGERKFPIDALSPERAIIRQNALTQARELVVGILGVTNTSDKDWTARQHQFNLLTEEVIRLAKKFEAYSAGDTDVEEAKKELAADKGK